jgi:hypothetical protein
VSPRRALLLIELAAVAVVVAGCVYVAGPGNGSVTVTRELGVSAAVEVSKPASATAR